MKRLLCAAGIVVYLLIGYRIGQWAEAAEIEDCKAFFLASVNVDETRWCQIEYRNERFPYVLFWPIWGPMEYSTLKTHRLQREAKVKP